jgi:hypothetical protein
MIAGELHEIINDDTSNKNKLYLKKNVTVILFIKLVSFPRLSPAPRQVDSRVV